MQGKEAFNTKSLNHMDERLRKLVDEHYDFCLYKCNQKAGGGMLNCKNNCVKEVIVPYRFNNHMARDEEDNLYRKCLSTKFPNIQQSDYIDCTQQLYKDRV
jgi:hypothetical protein